ncbi:MAG: zinc ribbon domain-containing protein, partial [Thermoplasmata archaeon]|nr:zinc ribbon domain-containing protein [Thermoplasmata archaeon]
QTPPPASPVPSAQETPPTPAAAQTPAVQVPEGQIACPSCNTLLNTDDVMCFNCGERVTQSVTPTAAPSVSGPAPPTAPEGDFPCPGCGTALSPGTVMCFNCGQSINAPQNPAQPTDAPKTVKKKRVI